MALYSYIKYRPSPFKLTARFLSYVLMTVGFGMLLWATFPILTYELAARISTRGVFVSPVKGQSSPTVLGTATALSQNVREFIQVGDWFPTRPQSQIMASEFTYKQYYLSIPKLGVTSATVAVGGDDLSRSLIHYLPTTAPGEYGSVNIFGHSTLPQLFNVKDYKTIFTYLPNLTHGDSITLTADGQQYEYEVYDMFVVKPDQIEVLEPKYDASYLTLITCVPPGTYWNRLIVRAKLKHLPFKSNNT